uniref:Uncharacterized protein n=1 Tax=Romanomermis culicivorax TaxID=13658 RepID=A0A915JU38_ROMCU
MIGIVNSIFSENKNLNDLLDENRKQIDDAAKHCTNLEKDLESTSQELSILKHEYEKSLKILRKELKKEQNSKLELEEKCRDLDDLIKMKDDLERKFEDLSRQKAISEFLEKQSNETIKDLLRQHDEDKKSIESLSVEVSKFRLISEQNAVRDVHFRNLNDTYNRLNEISKSLRHENNGFKIALHRFRYYRSVLIDQKHYLQINLDRYRDMVDEILEFLRVNQFSTPNFMKNRLKINNNSKSEIAEFDGKKSRKTPSFKSVGLVILAYFFLNKRYNSCLKLRSTLSIDKHDSFL